MSNFKEKIAAHEAKQTDALYDLIMSETREWRKDWSSDGYLQQSADTKNPYKNSNQLSLFSSAIKNNYKDPRWLTFNQIVKNGFKLDKGSKAEQISFTTKSARKLLKDEDGKPLLDSEGNKKYQYFELDKPILKIYNVFNASKIKGIEPFKLDRLSDENLEKSKLQKYQDIDKMIANFCKKNDITIKEISSDKAFFQNGTQDKTVLLPLKSQFKNLDSFYAVAFHELAHATKNLGIRINTETDTKQGNIFGSKNYAKEELTAELTSLYLCKEFGIDGSDLEKSSNNSLAYLKGWIQSGDLEKNDLNIAMKEAKRATNVIFNEYKTLNEELSTSQNINTPISIKKEENLGVKI